MKRLKNTEGKKEDQLDAIKDQGEKQLDAIKRQKQNKLKTTKKDGKVYLEGVIEKLFEMYPKFFTSKTKTLLKSVAKCEININYRNLSYEILLTMVNLINLIS